MYNEKILQILMEFKQNKLSIDEALEALKKLPYEDLGFAKIDYHREIRKGFPEVFFVKERLPSRLEKLLLICIKMGVMF